MEDISEIKAPATLFQHRLSLFLMGLLVLIGGSVLWVHKDYDPSQWREQSESRQGPGQGKADLLADLLPLSPPEIYNAATLSDKINGKADLYLSAGFQSMESQRFSLPEDNTRWMERYVYDMGGHPNAYAVFSLQRRGDIQPINITPHGYLSTNGLFLVNGPYYMEIIASEASEAMQSHLAALATAFVRAHPAAPVKLSELEIFVPENYQPNTTKLIADSAFGIEGLNWVYTSAYNAEQGQATAFIAKRASADQASADVEAFISFWNEYGAETVEVPPELSQARISFILDNYEIALVQGNYFFGVHEATSLDFGVAVTARLRQAIEEAAQ